MSFDAVKSGKIIPRFFRLRANRLGFCAKAGDGASGRHLLCAREKGEALSRRPAGGRARGVPIGCRPTPEVIPPDCVAGLRGLELADVISTMFVADRLWPKGTLCITIAANIGKTGILTFDACFPDSVVGFAPRNDVRTEFVQQWLAFVQPALERDAPQFAQKNINLAILRELTLINPPFDLQCAFAARVAEIDKLTAHHRVHLAKLDALFASLQHRAFRREL